MLFTQLIYIILSHRFHFIGNISTLPDILPLFLPAHTSVHLSVENHPFSSYTFSSSPNSTQIEFSILFFGFNKRSRKKKYEWNGEKLGEFIENIKSSPFFRQFLHERRGSQRGTFIRSVEEKKLHSSSSHYFFITKRFKSV